MHYYIVWGFASAPRSVAAPNSARCARARPDGGASTARWGRGSHQLRDAHDQPCRAYQARPVGRARVRRAHRSWAGSGPHSAIGSRRSASTPRRTRARPDGGARDHETVRTREAVEALSLSSLSLSSPSAPLEKDCIDSARRATLARAWPAGRSRCSPSPTGRLEKRERERRERELRLPLASAPFRGPGRPRRAVLVCDAESMHSFSNRSPSAARCRPTSGGPCAHERGLPVGPGRRDTAGRVRRGADAIRAPIGPCSRPHRAVLVRNERSWERQRSGGRRRTPKQCNNA